MRSAPLLAGALLVGALLLTACDGVGYHPLGFRAPGRHAPEFMLQRSDCTTCHGADLRGSPEAGEDNLTDVSCDSCHQEGWRTDCVYCHGGLENDSGAPPDGIGAGNVEFPHSAHVDSPNQADRDCTECHVKPDDVLSVGHVLDDTPAVSEVGFSAGQAFETVWDGAGCSNNACHGTGLGGTGDVQLSDAPLDCTGCHPGPGSEVADFVAMSGDHRVHESHGVACSECHPNIDADNTFSSPADHVNLQVEVALPKQMTWDNGHCTGRCHSEEHNGFAW